MRPLLAKVALRIAAVAAGLALAGLIAAAFGEGILVFYKALWTGAFGSSGRLLATLTKMIPLVLAGLAVAVPLKAGLFNIGGEGQMYAGALAFVAVALCAASLPAALLLPLAFLASVAVAAAWGALAGVLKAHFGVHEVIATIMLNFIALHAAAYLVTSGPMADPAGLGRTSEIVETARLPALAKSGVYALSSGLVVAIAVALAAWWFADKTVTGFRLRAVGGNPVAASRKGISVHAMTLVAMAVGGGLAGLGGALEVSGVQYSVSAAFSPGYGFDGVAVALLAAGNPLAAPLAAFLFAAIRAAGPALQLDAGLSPQLIYVIEAAIVIAAAVPAVPPALRRLRSSRRAMPSPDGARVAGEA